MNRNTSTAISKVSEARLQANCFQWAHNTYKEIRGLLFSVPNGGQRNLREAQLLKATGLVPGIPDLVLLKNGVHGFEFKSATGRVSPVQQAIHDKWVDAGHKIYLVNNEEDFKVFINSILRKN